ncbi:hypothetical protein J19TS2_38860 [Cohnella xylanilytica]|uniref:DUF1349 domain-containing protein n=1 Tax=Cohnella xylanilytica TaxID=557555 RepID=A0A841U6U5_9BACL|nr:DUF1349 domain-containing protein [Cohnella xylanilytica]MBB6693710.1 DUF1349 domain-containing protein [Cohnella xylanilytica]GIO14331.1 hypothetical protein J19TS2_38860 [Cohnella xylanilytica]
MFEWKKDQLFWIREPKKHEIRQDRVVLTTEPGTDLWQRTYYGFRNDNAPALVTRTAEPFFSFAVKTEFDSKRRYDQCGVLIYQNEENWFKASIEYENERVQRLGSVVTNRGYSDWATTDIGADVKSMYYRLSRRGSDYLIETSADGTNYKQMRIFHLFEGGGEIRFGIYACSPEESSFDAVFSEFEATECKWAEHR